MDPESEPSSPKLQVELATCRGAIVPLESCLPSCFPCLPANLQPSPSQPAMNNSISVVSPWPFPWLSHGSNPWFSHGFQWPRSSWVSPWTRNSTRRSPLMARCPSSGISALEASGWLGAHRTGGRWGSRWWWSMTRVNDEVDYGQGCGWMTMYWGWLWSRMIMI